ncbi:HlyD family efflux transporter periplasmic adaptor subunit [Methylosinus sp. H3A]|uniref:efflux RND transporter periplasmic adaptor subunit n=1 Tax=Methylosinus sp. H3A TaxID=2785786 RepID=UPI0028A1F8F4|nr:HlyD family efflux transporter periplasmic adaptor subunit [Methylosinus sp. H3A]
MSGIVEQVHVRVGEEIAAGAPLFKIEGRDIEAQLLARKSAIGAYEAKVAEAEAILGDYRSQLKNVERITDKRALAAEEFEKRKANVAIYSAKLTQAKADLVNARAQADESQVAIERRLVRAPISGQILQVNVRPGEFAAAAKNSTALMVIGETKRLNVRVDIDENDAWRFHAGEPARAFIRGNRDLFTDLVFETVEPYIRPKTSLTGASNERVDTRVLQVLYSFPRGAMPAFVGQQVEVFIHAPSRSSVPATSEPRSAPPGKTSAGIAGSQP